MATATGIFCVATAGQREPYIAQCIPVNIPVWKLHTLLSVYWVEPVPGLPYSKWQRESIWPQTSWLQHLPQRNGMILFQSIQIYCWSCLLGPYALLFLSIKLCISAWTDPFIFFCLKAPVHSSGCEQVTSSSMSWCPEQNLSS